MFSSASHQGVPWLIDARERGLFTVVALNEVMGHYLHLKQSGMVVSPAMPGPATLGPTASTGLLASTSQPAPISKAAPDTLPIVVPTPSTSSND